MLSYALLGLLVAAGPSEPDSRDADIFGAEPEKPAEAQSEKPAQAQSQKPSPPAPDVPKKEPTGSDRDVQALFGAKQESKFDTGEIKSDSIKVGGIINLFAQAAWRDGRTFSEGNLSTPFILDAYIDGRPNDRLRGFVSGRVQFDPTKLASSGSSSSSAYATAPGLTPATASNPAVNLDQLWLRFDIARRVFVTVGRQRVRWGVARIWYPTDFLNSRPRDALNPFDARLGVDMLKIHIPVEKLGWNFYGYGLLDGVNVSSTGLTVGQLGGALRGEFVFGPAELGLGAVWQTGRRPRYAIDLSSSLGPIDVYGEIALRDGRDFTSFALDKATTVEDALANPSLLNPKRREGVLVQATVGASWQFNYTSKNVGVLTGEYFFNQAGYESPREYQAMMFGPTITPTIRLDPSQSAPLYGGKHNLALTLGLLSLPRAEWISMTLSNIVIINDPSALTRLDVSFRVLNYLSIQLFVAALYGENGGQLRFTMSDALINGLANLAKTRGQDDNALRTSLAPLKTPVVAQAGVILRLSI